MVFANPSSRHLPADWLELTRWCLTGGPGAGTRQWASFLKWTRRQRPSTTIVSYSDPSQGHTGALYRACGWRWAPTWHRLRPPPTGNGKWSAAKAQAVKDRWVYLLAPDERRSKVLNLNDSACERRWPGTSFDEPKWRKETARSADYTGFRVFEMLQ
jgi:hypothetical protein